MRQERRPIIAVLLPSLDSHAAINHLPVACAVLDGWRVALTFIHIAIQGGSGHWLLLVVGGRNVQILDRHRSPRLAVVEVQHFTEPCAAVDCSAARRY